MARKPCLVVALAAALAAALAGCAGLAQQGDSDEPLQSSVITSKVRMALLADGGVPSSLDIRVQTHGGRVQLSGSVATEDEKRRAEEVARRVEGVAAVSNEIRLK
jgi:osmotically-inducible protein OsmY